MLDTTRLDPRIGMLNDGRFYAFAHGYSQPETVGSRAVVEVALGIRVAASHFPSTRMNWDVTMRFEHPAWDEVGGIVFEGINAASKSEAVQEARKQAERDGHAGGGRGRYWFSAANAD